MLVHTFIHLPGIGGAKEQALWNAGIHTWDDLEDVLSAQHPLFPENKENRILDTLKLSREALARRDYDFFAERLPKREHYRIALADPSAVVFLDIETTGLSLYYDKLTILGVGNRTGYQFYSHGERLSHVFEIVQNASCLVTFNGTLFDLKFIRKEFSDIRLPRAHVDLRFFARSVGLGGPQKTVEAELGLSRSDDIKEILGSRAPTLWYKYRLGDIDAGKRLIEYNYADIEGMKFIFDAALTRYMEKMPAVSCFFDLPSFYKPSKSLRWASRRSTEKTGRLYLPPYRGKVGPQFTYQDLVTDAWSRQLKVVGIDLTGSEKRASGWCLLTGSVAETKLLNSDRELIDQTMSVCPDLVSIDSPLSLPKGRITVNDNDPGRAKFGITRECERLLKKRGISVYPCLIRSMQGLTSRGIRLAAELRSRGIPVIESYPGAAQDIMGIPRKRASLEYLKRGLGKFGVVGRFLDEKVSHDEVDAVTSAIVGLFFWSGKFERLGNPDEEYLIVPDLHVPPDPWRQRVVMGISGPIASGKTTGARCLERQGFAYGRFSLILAKLLKDQGKKPTRSSLQRLGGRVHHDPGQRWLCQKLIESLPGDSDLVIDGLRFPDDHAFLVESFGPAFNHMHVTASEEIRIARYVADGGGAAEFKKASRHQVERQVPRLASLAERVLENDGTKRSYESKVRRAALRAREALCVGRDAG